VYKGHQGPVTSLAIWDTGSWLALFTASWDKTIRVWDATVSPICEADKADGQTGELKHELQGHTDFVKSLTIIPGTTPYLITTSSDRSIRLWDLTPLKEGVMPKSTLPIKEHTRPVDCAAWRFDEAGHLTIWTADSMGVIKEWEIESGKLKYVKDWKGHETSISCLHVVEDGLWSGMSSVQVI
jgi:WD40 repeat protein